MSESAVEESNELEFEARPSRLGLGAKVRRNAEVPDSTDPVERNLIKKLGVGKRRSYHNSKEKHSDEHEDEDEDDDDDEPQSRASAFSKKRPDPPVPHFQTKKKHKL